MSREGGRRGKRQQKSCHASGIRTCRQVHVVGIKTADWWNTLITEGPETHTIQNVHDIQNYLEYKECQRKRQSTDASVKMT